jgi:hypothetical protein
MKAVWASSLAVLLGGAAVPSFAGGPDALPPVELAPGVVAPAGDGSAVTDPAGAGRGGGLYGSAEYLLWWVKQTRLPPLVTSGSASVATSGPLGGLQTNVLFGGRDVGGQPYSGGRFTLGFWVGDDQAFGVEGGYFLLEQRRIFFSASATSASDTFIGLPFIDVSQSPPAPNVLPVAGAGLTGGVSASVVQRLSGAEVNTRLAAGGDEGVCLSLLGGFRVLAEDEGLDLNTDSTDPTGLNTRSAESFTTHNRFYGGQVGVAADWQGPAGLSVEVVGKIAIGATSEVVRISGITVNTDPLAGTTSSGAVALLAQAINTGRHARTEWAVLPEMAVKVGYPVTEHVTLTVGGSFLYLSAAARPGNQIDANTTVPVVGVPSGLTQPSFVFRSNDFYAGGMNFGVELHF